MASDNLIALWRLTLECGHLRIDGPWDADEPQRHMIGDMTFCEICPRRPVPGTGEPRERRTQGRAGMSGVDDLAAFLRARYDEAEQMATWARGTIPIRQPSDSSGNVRPFRRADQQALEMYSAAFKPEKMLADIAAKRQIIQLHSIVHRGIGWLEDGDEERAEIPVCGSCVPKHSYYGCRADVPEGPCLTARLLVLPYADHYDYQEKWRP